LSRGVAAGGALQLNLYPEPRRPSFAGPNLTERTVSRRHAPAGPHVMTCCRLIGPVLATAIELVGESGSALDVSADGAQPLLFICLCDVDENGRVDQHHDAIGRLARCAAGEWRRGQTSRCCPPQLVVLPPRHSSATLVAGRASSRGFARHLGSGGIRRGLATRTQGRDHILAVGPTPSVLRFGYALPMKDSARTGAPPSALIHMSVSGWPLPQEE